MLRTFYAFDQRQFKILAAEDDSVIADELKDIFTKQNCIIDVFPTGDEMLAALDKKDYDMVWVNVDVSDCHDGYGIAKAIRARKDPVSRIPIYLFTSDSYHSCIKEANDAEINGYVGKPFSNYLCTQFLEYLRSKF